MNSRAGCIRVKISLCSGDRWGAQWLRNWQLSYRPAAVVLEATLSSVLDVTHEQVPWTRYVPIGLLLRSRFDAASYVSRSSVPKLIFHGGSDTTISRTNSERIFASARSPKQIHLIPGGDHNGLDLVDPELYHGILRDFLAEFGAL